MTYHISQAVQGRKPMASKRISKKRRETFKEFTDAVVMFLKEKGAKETVDGWYDFRLSTPAGNLRISLDKEVPRHLFSIFQRFEDIEKGVLFMKGIIYTVHVSSYGKVHETKNKSDALRVYRECIEMNKTDRGYASRQTIELKENNKVIDRKASMTYHISQAVREVLEDLTLQWFVRRFGRLPLSKREALFQFLYGLW